MLPMKTDLLACMKIYDSFVDEKPNHIIPFITGALIMFRFIDSTSWKPADLLQHVGDHLAAELRQAQRIIAIFSAGKLALGAFLGDTEPDASV